jgi:hypothetical protein
MKDYFSIRDVNVAAKFCVLCARIKFDEKVQKEFKVMDTGKYKSINLWMANNPRQAGSKESYYEYILDDTQKQSFFNTPIFEYSTDKPYAVVFVRLNMQGALDAVTKASYFIDKTLSYSDSNTAEPVNYANVLRLVPYESLSDECDYLVGSEI